MINLNDYRPYNVNIFTSKFKPNDYVRFTDNYDNIIRGWIIEARFTLDEVYYAIQADCKGNYIQNIHDEVEQERIVGLIDED
jgi:hypothetical protein